MPQYRKNLCRVFGEEFLAEATQKEKIMSPIIKLIKEKDWETLKQVSPYFYSLKRDLAVTPTGCVLYDNRLMIPAALKQLVINARITPNASGTNRNAAFGGPSVVPTNPQGCNSKSKIVHRLYEKR